jgi:FSR family fosmidomycin resistance protein-like MFS transporter
MGDDAQRNRVASKILGTISLTHFLNDTMQSLMIAIYPLLKNEFSLTFTQIGLITFTFQFSASILQPLVGFYTDKHPKPYSLAFGMACTFFGLVLLSQAGDFYHVLISAAMIGMGSSIFHPESSRIARMASGGRHGLAQSIFQIGGNIGSAFGPLLAAWFILPNGQKSILYVSILALMAIVLLIYVGNWYKRQHLAFKAKNYQTEWKYSRKKVIFTIFILLVLMFSKFFYLSSISSYLMFYLMHQFQIDAQMAQYHLFYFLAAVAAGTILGGPIGDKIGRKIIILVSIFGIAPFALALPYVGLNLSILFTSIIGFMLASAFPAIVVYAQELMPGKVGTVSGLFFGIAFGLGGIGSAVLGYFIDIYGIVSIYKVCAFLPLLGIFAVLLP